MVTVFPLSASSPDTKNIDYIPLLSQAAVCTCLGLAAATFRLLDHDLSTQACFVMGKKCNLRIMALGFTVFIMKFSSLIPFIVGVVKIYSVIDVFS